MTSEKPLGVEGGASKTGQTGSGPSQAASTPSTGFDLLGDLSLLSGSSALPSSSTGAPPMSTGAPPMSTGVPPTSGMFNGLLDSSPVAPPFSGGGVSPLQSHTIPSSIPLALPTNPLPPTSMPMTAPPPGPTLGGADPLAALDQLFIPIDTVKPAGMERGRREGGGVQAKSLRYFLFFFIFFRF